MFSENNAKEILREFAYHLNIMAGEFEEGVEIEEGEKGNPKGTGRNGKQQAGLYE